MKTFCISKMNKTFKNFNQIQIQEMIIYMILNRLLERKLLILMTKKIKIKNFGKNSKFILKIKAQKIKIKIKINQREKS